MTLAYVLWILFFILICVIALIAICGWVYDGGLLEKERSKNEKLMYENERLRNVLRRRNSRSNIEVANDYYKELYKDEGNS